MDNVLVQCIYSGVSTWGMKWMHATCAHWWFGLSGDNEAACVIADSNTPPQAMCSLSLTAKCLTFGDGSTLVRVLVIMSLVGQKTRWILLSSTTQWMKWKCMLMCFVCVWYWWSLVSAIADWLSENKVMGLSRGTRTSSINKHSHSASFMTCIVATYSLLVVESEMISCFFNAQDMAPLSIRNT